MTTLDDLFFIPKEIRERICIHRGLFKSEDKENTVSAIRDAVELNPYFVEFDIQKYNGSFFSGHPPAIVTGNDGKLGNILSVYSEHARQVRANGQNFKRITFPKIDLKLNGEDNYEKLIDGLISILENPDYEDIPFYLVNLGQVYGARYLSTLLQFANLARDLKERVGLNVDLEKLGTYDEKTIDKDWAELDDFIFSVSPEIHTADVGDNFLLFIKQHNIKHVHFWLLGPPNNPCPSVYLNTLRYVLGWGQSNHLTVYFDINPKYVANELCFK